MHDDGAPGAAATPRRTVPRSARTGLALAAIVTGAALTGSRLRAAQLADLARYAYRDRGDPTGPAPEWIDTVRQHLPAALPADVAVVVGGGLVLGGCAWLFRLWAISRFGRTASGCVLTAVGVALVAGLVEDALLYWTLHWRPNPAPLVIATAATATIRWSTVLLVMIGGIPAVAGIGVRALRAGYERGRTRGHTPPWWDRVWVGAALPVARCGAEQDSWRRAYNVPGAEAVIENRKPEPVQAICLSGGGVRSACVAMGVMQEFSKAPALAPPPDPRARLLDTADYVISVSGGGYSAGARLLAVQRSPGSAESPLLSQRFEQGSPEFDYFRRHSSYIADSPTGLIRALWEVLRNLLASMIILFTPAVVLGAVAGYLLALPCFSFAVLVPVPADIAIDPAHPQRYPAALVPHPASWGAVVFFAVGAGLLTLWAILVECVSSSERTRAAVSHSARASVVFALAILVVIAGLPGLMRFCSTVSVPAGQHVGKTVATLTGVVGLNYVAAIAAMAWKKRTAFPLGAAAEPSWWKRVLPPSVLWLTLVLVTLAVLLLVWLLLLGSFAAGVFGRVTGDGHTVDIDRVPYWELWFVVLLLTVLSFGLVDVTSLSLHPFYRTRLARTFAVRRIPPAPGTRQWRAECYGADEWTWLHELGSVPAGGPRFVFAAAATLGGDAKPAPGLNAVSYVLSADHIGGPELGWLRTAALLDVVPPRIKRDLTVEAAMAVSGAAFASAMGRKNRGFQKLLAVSGARLGTWLPNPNFVATLVCAAKGNCADPIDNETPWQKFLPRIRGAGYFYRELFGLNYGDARLVQVTDGGHYENLGLVEALRRRCGLIFCIDGGGDTPPLLTGLSDAMRLAEYELGVTITLDDEGDYAVDAIAPGSGTPFGDGHPLARLNRRLTKGTVVAGRISYPAAAGLDTGEGLLVFAKAVVWEGCPEWLLTYAASNDSFPHDPTADQWFTEDHFAAYTELGRIMGRAAVECAEAAR
ncbi:hypothetical protein [Nocardia sp. alder85J]|uniref:hypothetical protein n=1 Tax=Nocardia sp. alder85J TaxID=2862949 RepID=UPI001CD665FE|nr:hypothetical protein [Nocardia sp. alder85J]MCX4091968.1 hypothetical protein [Nocardia sp. alder85J]